MGICYDRREVRWGDLEPGMYVIGKGSRLWKLLEERAGVWMVQDWRDAEPRIWAAQDPDRMTPVADLHPADPLSLLREMLGATPFAFRRNDDGVWICAPWPAEKPGNEPYDLYRAHLTEFHGIKVPRFEYDKLHEYHTEHHTAGITHAIPHTHPER